jgi:outer membrane immunogenic protein
MHMFRHGNALAHLLYAAAITSPGCLAGVAQAADLPTATKAPPAVQASGWSGCYVGLQGGYGWGHASTNDVPDFQLDQRGGFAGGLAGYNFQVATRVVAGLEVDAAYANARAGNVTVHPNSFAGDTTNISNVGVNAFGTVRGRIGYAFNTILPYLTGGFAWAHTRMDYSQPVTLMGAFFADASDAHTSKYRAGWALGAGVEYAVAPHWSAKVEYLRLDFGTASYPAVGFPSFGGIPFDIDSRLTLHTVKMALAYRF